MTRKYTTKSDLRNLAWKARYSRDIENNKQNRDEIKVKMYDSLAYLGKVLNGDAKINGKRVVRLQQRFDLFSKASSELMQYMEQNRKDQKLSADDAVSYLSILENIADTKIKSSSVRKRYKKIERDELKYSLKHKIRTNLTFYEGLQFKKIDAPLVGPHLGSVEYKLEMAERVNEELFINGVLDGAREIFPDVELILKSENKPRLEAFSPEMEREETQRPVETSFLEERQPILMYQKKYGGLLFFNPFKMAIKRISILATTAAISFYLISPTSLLDGEKKTTYQSSKINKGIEEIFASTDK